MRILLATDAWSPQVNGVVRTLTRVVGELREMGEAVEVISPDQFPTFPLPTYPEIKLAMGAYEKVQERFKAFEPEAIHIATEGPIGLAARRICLEWKLPFTTSYHTRFPRIRLGPPPRAARSRLRLHEVVPPPVRPAHGGHADHARRTRKARLPQHLPVVEGAGHRDVPSSAAGRTTSRTCSRTWPRPIWLYVGRVAVEKNIEAFVTLDLPGTKIVVGDGPQREALEAAHPEVNCS